MSHLPRAIRKSSTPWLLCQCRACSMLTVPTATRTRAARAPRAWQAPKAWRAPRAWRAETAIWAATRRTGAPRFPFEGADDADGIWRMGWWWNMIDHWILWHLGLLLLFVSRSIYQNWGRGKWMWGERPMPQSLIENWQIESTWVYLTTGYASFHRKRVMVGHGNCNPKWSTSTIWFRFGQQWFVFVQFPCIIYGEHVVKKKIKLLLETTP